MFQLLSTRLTFGSRWHAKNAKQNDIAAATANFHAHSTGKKFSVAGVFDGNAARISFSW
jgi:hypothetical protein